MPANQRTKLTPPEVARRWGISADKVLQWIRAGELRAINAASTPGGKPRYLIDIGDLAAFENRRTVTAASKTSHRRNSTGDVIEYF